MPALADTAADAFSASGASTSTGFDECRQQSRIFNEAGAGLSDSELLPSTVPLSPGDAAATSGVSDVSLRGHAAAVAQATGMDAAVEDDVNEPRYQYIGVDVGDVDDSILDIRSSTFEGGRYEYGRILQPTPRQNQSKSSNLRRVFYHTDRTSFFL